MKFKKVCLGVMALILFAGFANAESVKEVSPEELKDDLKMCKGSVLLLNFFNTNYPQAKKQLMDLREIASLNQHIKIVAVGFYSQNEDLYSVQSFADQYKLNYPVYITDIGYKEEYDIKTFPTTLIVSTQGDILETIKYYISNADLKKKVSALFQEEIVLKNRTPSYLQ